MCEGVFRCVCGPMFSGKTTELIRQARSCLAAGRKIVVFKHKIDDRYSFEKVVTHDGDLIEAILVSTSQDIQKWIDKNPSVYMIFIDEVQFFDEGIKDVISNLLRTKHNVTVVGLDMDFMGNPFPVAMWCLATADIVLKLKGICKDCQGDSTFSWRLDFSDNKEIVSIGGAEAYVPLCRSCYYRRLTNQ